MPVYFLGSIINVGVREKNFTKKIKKKVEHKTKKSCIMEITTRPLKEIVFMLYINNIEKFIGLQELIVKNIVETGTTKIIEAEIDRKEQKCPCCGCMTDKVHDYRKQEIKDIPAFGEHVIINLRKRRYRCPACNKRFIEHIDWLPLYHRMTNRLSAYVIDRLREARSYKSIAREVNLSSNTVTRIFDLVNYASQQMPEVIGIDEFKGNAGGDKYQCIITDIKNGRVLDVLATRHKYELVRYFKGFDRSNTTHYVCDMWDIYADISRTFFKSAELVIDKYHFIRQVFWAFEEVRKKEQKKLRKDTRLLFKRSKTLLTKQYEYLTDDEKATVNSILYMSTPLVIAHNLKEKFLKILKCVNSAEAKELLSEWIMIAQDSGLERFIACSNTFINWSEGILNSFDCPYTNGFTEGCNNKIKALKRVGYGYRNFRRFRNRIIHIFNQSNTPPQLQKSEVA